MKGKVKIAMVVTLIAALILVAFCAVAAEPAKKAPSPKQLAQQEKMKACNAEAKTKGLKGDERKKFMSECLKSKPAAAKPAKPGRQEKVKACSAEAKTKGLKGDEQKKFMEDCLKTVK